MNVPPDRRGLISANDSAALMGFKKLRDENFKNNLLKQAHIYYEFSEKDLLSKKNVLRSFDSLSTVYGANIQDFVVEFSVPTKINCIILREAIRLGQTIRKFKIELLLHDKPVKEISGTTIGRKRILTFSATTITSFRVHLDDKNGNDNVSGVAAYFINENLIGK